MEIVAIPPWQNIISNLVQSLSKTIDDEEKKFFIKKNSDEHRYNTHVVLLEAAKTRRLHMIERRKYVTKQNLTIFFKPINHIGKLSSNGD